MCGGNRRAQIGGAFLRQQAIGPSGEVWQASEEMRVAALVELLQAPEQDGGVLIVLGEMCGGQGFDLLQQAAQLECRHIVMGLRGDQSKTSK